MIQFISLFSALVLKYLLFYLFLFLLGRSFILIIQILLFNTKDLPDEILKLRSSIIYPVVGLVFLGNFLILLNFFMPLKSPFVLIILFSLIFINFLNLNLKISFYNFFTLNNLLFYLAIPSILIISSSTTNFHYDAGYYHLNHQNWLRESNLIIGMVNIFWPFGMSSINEYISAFFWFDSSFILLHFLTLFFIHFFFIFISYNLLLTKNKNLKAASFFLLFFSFLDNFGLSGGRNGFPFIQGVGKQDIAVGILYCFVSLLIFNSVKQKRVSEIDFVTLSLLTFFIFQLKVSGVIVFFLYFVFCFFLINNHVLNLKNIIYFQIPTIIFGVIWGIKSYLTTGCLIFPLSLSCINNFDWYLPNSTKAYEEISTVSSLAYMEYFVDKNLTFFDWFNDFFLSQVYVDLAQFYRSVYLNFLISLIAIYILRLVIFRKEHANKNFKLIVITYLGSSFIYLLFFGPIPRYAMGTLLTVVGIFGFYSKGEKYNLNKYFVYLLIIICVGLIPRANSYVEFIRNPQIAIFDPRLEEMYIEEQIHENWIRPDRGDRCWINLKCTMHKEDIYISEESFFKVAYRIKE
jgi:hypothetical protein